MKKITPTFLLIAVTIMIAAVAPNKLRAQSDTNQTKMKVWPVPATDNFINVKITDPNANGKVTVYDAKKKQLIQKNYYGGQTLRINLLAVNDKPIGNAIYVTTFQSSDGKIFVSNKFVKQ
jgi:hypothetical protein